MRRFYRDASVRATPGGFEILLDGKPVRAPGGGVLTAPTARFAAAVAAEWNGQGETIRPAAMKLTQLLTNICEVRGREAAPVVEGMLAYLETDLLCYRAAADQPVAARQAAAWDPWLAWFRDRFGAAPPATDGLLPAAVPPALKAAVTEKLASLPEDRLSVARLAVSLSGSLILGLAFCDGALTPVALLQAMFVEEDFKAEIYREDIHGLAPLEEKRRADLRAEADAMAKFLETSEGD